MKKILSTWILILFGVMIWSVTIVKSGWLYSFGMGFWGANGHDGVWHIALINSITRGSWEMPVFSGSILKNYHFGFDLILACLNKITIIPTVNLYFQIIPPILAVLIGLLVYKLVYKWTNSYFSVICSLFFVYFGGNFGWIVTFLRNQGIGGESMFWSQQAISTLVNPPFALSLTFILLGLFCLLKYQEKQNLLFIFFSSILFGILIEVKIYAGLLVLGGLLVAGIWKLIKEKKFDVLLVFLVSLIISSFLFLPSFKSSSQLLIFKPFWFLETMMVLTDRVGWIRFGEAMVNYRSGGVWLKAIIAYLVAFGIFIIGNFGTRLIVFWQLKNLKKFNWIDIFFFAIIGAGIVIPMFFVQSGTAWNTIQFFYYSLFLSAILGGITLNNLLDKQSKKLKYIVIFIVVLLTFPTTIGALKHYLPNQPPAMISNEEIKALNFLKEKPLGVVLTYPYDQVKAKEAAKYSPRPLYLYESTAYVSAFSNKPVYLEDQVNLDITGYDWEGRRIEVEKFYQSLNQKEVREFLKNNNIRYIYWLKGQRATLGETQLGIKRIFENNQVDIYQVELN